MIKLIQLLVIGTILALIDIVPMIKSKIDKYSIISAFIYHLIMPFILFNISNSQKVILGFVVYLICSIPIVVLVFKEDRKSVPIILVSSMILGAISGFIMQTLFM